MLDQAAQSLIEKDADYQDSLAKTTQQNKEDLTSLQKKQQDLLDKLTADQKDKDRQYRTDLDTREKASAY